jgi:hypothetical protein
MNAPLRVLRRRALASLGAVGLSLAVLIACSIDARARRARSARDFAGLPALAAQLPAADVAFTGGARWLRAPSLEEPGAAQADGIAFPDPEPGGGALVAPRAAWAEQQAEPRR